MSSSVLSPKFIYLISIICEVWVNNSEWMKSYLTFMPKGGTTCPKLSIFCNLSQFTKIYVTNFVPSQFWWIADWGFNDIKFIFIQILSRLTLNLTILYGSVVNTLSPTARIYTSWETILSALVTYLTRFFRNFVFVADNTSLLWFFFALAGWYYWKKWLFTIYIYRKR